MAKIWRFLLDLAGILPWVVPLVIGFLAWWQQVPWYLIALSIVAAVVLIIVGINQVDTWRERHRKKISKLSDKEVKELILKWIVKPYFKLQPVEGDPFLFGFNIDHLNIRSTMVFRMRNDPYYIHIGSRVVPPKEVSDILSRMNVNGWVDLQENISLELLRYGIKFTGVDEIPIKEIQVTESIPLDDWLTEHHFIERIMYVMRAGTLAGGYFFHYAKLILKQQDKIDAEKEDNQA